MAWYDTDWDYRVKVTVDKTKLGGSNYANAMLVDLSDLPAGFFTNVKSDGTDIVVTDSDGTTKKKRWLESLTAASSIGELYFLGTASSSADTDFYIYYGNAAGAETNDADTYDANYVLVCHMKDDPDTTHVADSTANNNDGTKDGAGTPAEVAGIVGKGQQGSGNQNITWGSGASLDITGNITIMVFHNGARPTNDYFLSKTSGANGFDFIEFDNLYFRSNQGTYEASDSTVPAGWYSGAVIGAGTTGTFVLNGASDGTFTYTAPNSSAAANAVTLIRNTFIGDELWVSNTNRAVAFVTAWHNNLSSPSTFYSAIGTQEEQPAAGGFTIFGDEAFVS